LATCGCASQWVYSYVEAERVAADQVRELLIVYRDHLDLRSADLEEAVRGPQLAPALKKYVLCSLVSAYPPNRKYLAQFGVVAPPALVVVHTDGTYHARTEDLSPAGIAQFLTAAQPPGNQPRHDISVPRSTDYLLHAEGIYDNALEKAQRLNRQLLIVYKWWLDDESTRLIARMSRPEVAARCAGAVCCVLDWDYMPNRRHVARYGVSRYPALIVVHRNGSSDVLEGPAETDRIVAFLSRTLDGAGAAGNPNDPPLNPHASAAKPGWRWSTDFLRARERAGRAGVGLFVFLHNPADADSARMMQLLQSDAAAAVLDTTVNCSLNDAPAIRDLLKPYGVTRAPTFLAIRPDNSYRRHEGTATLDQLRGLRDFLPH